MTDNAVKLLLEALDFAAQKHRRQRRKDADATPYINHPIAAAALLARSGVTAPVPLAAALLHDTVEDTNTTVDELRNRFGAEIAAAVAEVTDDRTLPRATRKRLQVDHAPALSAPARLVKLADKICNVADLAEHPPAAWPRTRCLEYIDWCREVIAGLRGSHAGLEALFDTTCASAREALTEESP